VSLENDIEERKKLLAGFYDEISNLMSMYFS